MQGEKKIRIYGQQFTSKFIPLLGFIAEGGFFGKMNGVFNGPEKKNW